MKSFKKEKEKQEAASVTSTVKKPSGDEYDPRKDLSKYKFPSVDLLADHGSGDVRVDEGELVKKKEQIVETLRTTKSKLIPFEQL